jgi:hypothetical protein
VTSCLPVVCSVSLLFPLLPPILWAQCPRLRPAPSPAAVLDSVQACTACFAYAWLEPRPWEGQHCHALFQQMMRECMFKGYKSRSHGRRLLRGVTKPRTGQLQNL